MNNMSSFIASYNSTFITIQSYTVYQSSENPLILVSTTVKSSVEFFYIGLLV